MIGNLRDWANRHTGEGRFSPVGIAFHWLMAALILFQLGWGLWTDVLMPGGDKIFAYQVHSAAGLPVFVFGILRAGWRLLVKDPYNDADQLGIQTTIAHVTAYLFYLSFALLPLSGWIMWSAVAPPGPLRLGGLFPWPQLPLEGFSLEARYRILDAAEDVHEAMIILLLVLIPAHVGAALKHHFWDRHDVLTGMLPEVPDWKDERPVKPQRPKANPSPKGSEAG